MKKILYVILAAFMAFTLTSCGNDVTTLGETEELEIVDSTYEEEAEEGENVETNETTLENYEDIPEEVEEEVKVMDKLKAVMKVKDFGEIEIELLPEYAPITVANFQKLVSDGFYDNLTFHRIMQGFMIQGGDPEGNGTGGSEETIKGEFESNGVKNDLSHKRGVVSMARSMNPNSASSQFFICDADDEFLDGDYAAFGRVTKGMDVVDKIAKDVSPKAVDNNGSIEPADQPIIETIVLK